MSIDNAGIWTAVAAARRANGDKAGAAQAVANGKTLRLAAGLHSGRAQAARGTQLRLVRESRIARDPYPLDDAITGEQHESWCKCQRVCGGDQ